MAIIDNSPQYKELTTSNDGRNVRASLQAVSHFFLEDNIFSQTETDSFGAKSAAAFATTARVTFTGTKQVYSICQGQVFIQPQTGSADKVNVILKPYKQPINSIPIKYIIYRGLNKDDFFSSIQHEGNSRLRIAGSESTGTGFVQYIWKEFNKFYANVPGGIPVFLEEFIGFPASENSQNLTDLLDSYFYHISQYDENTGEEIEETAYELPLIPRGIHIGNATGSIGIDIVMNNGEYYIENDPTPFRFDLDFARSAYHTLQTDVGNTDYENKLLKEIAAQFIDIASLYGMHASGVCKLYMGEQTVPLTAKEDIYSTISPFFTKSTVYLYIQSDRQRSYNFYGNYVLSDTNPNNLKTGTSESALTETSFGTNGWPVHKMDNITDQLVLSLVTDNNTNAAVYAKIGFVTSEHEDNFVRNENLLVPQLFDDDETDTAIQYTKPIMFSFPVSGQNTITSVVQLIYEGMEIWIEDSQSTGSFYYLKDIDDVFGLIDAQSLTAIRSDLELPTFIDNNLRIINFPNPQRNTDIGVVKTKRNSDAIAIDDHNYLVRVTFETLLDSIRQDTKYFLSTTSPSIDSVATATNNYQPNLTNNYYQLPEPYFFQTNLFTHQLDTITGISIKENSDSLPSKKIVGITKEEYDTLKGVMLQNELFNSTLFFSNIDGSGSSFTSPEGTSYYVYRIGLAGEDDSGTLLLSFPEDDILVFSLDLFCFFSDGYSSNMPDLSVEELFVNDENKETL